MESLSLKVFQQYFVRIINEVQEHLWSLIHELHHKNLVGKNAYTSATGTSGLTEYQRTRIIVTDIEQTIATSKDNKTLMEFCGALSTLDNLKPLSDQIMQTYG